MTYAFEPYGEDKVYSVHWILYLWSRNVAIVNHVMQNMAP